jgi:hypothetical protein
LNFTESQLDEKSGKSAENGHGNGVKKAVTFSFERSRFAISSAIKERCR